MNAQSINPRDHLRQLDQGLLDTLLKEAHPPCISIYMPAHRLGQQTRENALRFRSLLQQAHDELASKDPATAERLTAPLMSVAEDDEFWQHQLAGLAVFQDADKTIFVRLPRPLKGEVVAVADSFHIKPLIRAMQGVDRYQLLAVTQKSVDLYEGDLDRLDPVPLHPSVPRTLIDAIGGEVWGSLNVNHYGGLAHSGMFHGHHDNRDDRDIDLERYFRVLDKAIYDFHCRGGDLPMYLAADVDYHDRFQKVSHHPRLQKEGVKINPGAVEVTPQRLREEMNQILRPQMHERTRELFEQYGNARSKGLGSDELASVAQAAANARISVLMLDGEKRIGGRVDPQSGMLTPASESDPAVDDVLDDLAEMTLRTGGRVLVMPGEIHPASSGVAAVYRY